MLFFYAYHMDRTTLLLDERTRRAAKDLARRYDCSTSEAIRRAVWQQYEATAGIPAPSRVRRRRILSRLFELFEGSDPAEEVRRLKSDDEGF